MSNSEQLMFVPLFAELCHPLQLRQPALVYNSWPRAKVVLSKFNRLSYNLISTLFLVRPIPNTGTTFQSWISSFGSLTRLLDNRLRRPRSLPARL